MFRIAIASLFGLSACSVFAANAVAIVPEAIVKDIDDGYGSRALAQLRPLLQQSPHDRDVQYRYGSALLAAGKFDDAQKAMKAALESDPNAPELHRVLGEAYGAAAIKASIFGMAGLAKSSLAEFQTAVKLNPNDPDSRVDLASYYIQAPGIVGGSLDKAHEEEAVLDKLSPLQALQIRASEAENEKDFPAAVKLLRQAIEIDKKTDSLVQLGMMQLHTEHASDALTTFKSLTARSDAPASSWYYLARSVALTHAAPAEGIAALKVYIALPERPDQAPKLAWAHLRLGELYAQNNQKDLAAGELDAARKQPVADDSNFDSALKKAQALLK